LDPFEMSRWAIKLPLNWVLIVADYTQIRTHTLLTLRQAELTILAALGSGK
jgi:hypothetical protein